MQRGPRTAWDAWSRVSPALGPAPFAEAAGVAGHNTATSARGTLSWSRAPTTASSPGPGCPFGSHGATYWSRGLCAEGRADSTSWGGPGGSDCPTSWDSGLQTACTASSKEHQSSDLTASSEPTQQLGRAILAHYPKSNHRGERSGRLGLQGAKLECREAGLDAEGVGAGKLARGGGT